mgnify:CR=1 FL=1
MHKGGKRTSPNPSEYATDHKLKIYVFDGFHIEIINTKNSDLFWTQKCNMKFFRYLTDCYKNVQGNWVKNANLNTPRSKHTMTTMGNSMIVAGGRNNEGFR